ncbi:MAG TPA: hypothetical protein VGF39_15800 [Stellaceae bacterium]|jgi:hypothetical protein
MIINDKDMRDALNRVGLTPDGEILYVWLQWRLLELANSLEPGALQANEGARILATELMRCLSAGVAEDHARARHERAIYFEHRAAAEQRADSYIGRRRARLAAGLDPLTGQPGLDGHPGPGDSAA